MLSLYKYSDIDTKNIGTFDDVYFEYKTENSATLLLIETGHIELIDNKISGREPNDEFDPVKYGKHLLRITLDEKQEECIELKQFLERMDNFFSSRKIRILIFGDKHNMCEYQPFIKKLNRLKIPYCDLFFRKNSQNENTTKIVENINDKKVIKEIRSQHDLYYEIPVFTKVKLIFEISRIWSKKYIIGDEKKIIYGVKLVVQKCEYILPKNKETGTIFDNIELLSSDEDDNSD